MRRVLLVIVFAILAAYCFGVVQVGASLDFGGKQHYEPSIGELTQEDWDVENGWSPSLEFMLQKSNFKLGIGSEYQLQRSVKDSPVEFNFTPVYAVARYVTDINTVFVPETVIQCGYNFFQAEHFNEEVYPDRTGGLYYGLGECFTYKEYVLQFLYKVNSGKLSGPWFGQTNDLIITNRQFSLSLGYRF